MNKPFPKYFKIIVDHLRKKYNIDVVIGNMTCFTGHEQKKIIINYRFNLEKNGLYALLHEVGHSLQPATATGPNLYKIIDDMEYPTQFKMYQFLNEADAWDRGARFADELNIPIDLRQWNKIKEEALLTYFV